MSSACKLAPEWSPLRKYCDGIYLEYLFYTLLVIHNFQIVSNVLEIIDKKVRPKWLTVRYEK